MRRIEKHIERLIFASRWLLAPFYIGLSLSLAILMVKFLQELAHLAPGILSMGENDVILAILSMVDLTLTGSLLVMVIFAGYENFVSKIDTANNEDRPEWMGKVDFSSLKLKLVASIVAISAVQLLKMFMNPAPYDNQRMAWMVGTHMAFVVSGVLLALMDRIAEGGKHGSDSSS